MDRVEEVKEMEDEWMRANRLIGRPNLTGRHQDLDCSFLKLMSLGLLREMSTKMQEAKAEGWKR